MAHKANCIYFEGAGECNCIPAEGPNMTTAQRLAIEHALSVHTDGRVLVDMTVAGKTYTRVTDVAQASFQMGFEAAEKHHATVLAEVARTAAMPRLYGSALTFLELAVANASRVEKWHSLEDLTVLEWAGAMCGESGEAANFAKKLRRVQSQMANKDARLFGGESLAQQVEIYKRGVIKEYADTVIYGVLMCLRAGFKPEEIGEAVRQVFNNKSIEYGFPERL